MRFPFFLFLLVISTMAGASTTLSYQGYLEHETGPVDDTVEMSFALFDAESDGNQVGDTINIAEVSVHNGLFQVGLDFGEKNYASGLWLAIEVEGESLEPRQPITGAPFAISSVSDDPPSEECEDYCTAMGIGCADVYSTTEQCLDACAGFSTDGSEGDTTGDTFQCRSTWLQMGFDGDVPASEACANAADTSPECVD